MSTETHKTVKKIWEIDVYVTGTAKRCRRVSIVRLNFKTLDRDDSNTVPDLVSLETAAMILVRARMKSWSHVEITATPVTFEEMPTADGTDTIVIRSVRITGTNPRHHVTRLDT